MNVKEFEKKEKSTAEMTVAVTPEEFEAAVQKAYIKNRGRINVPGFRKGKAPRKMIESMYGAGIFYEDAVESIAPEALDAGIREKELDTVGRPSILDFEIGGDKSLTIKFRVSLYPEVTLSQYRGIAAPKMAVSVTQEDVDREIARTREQNARIQAVERKAEKGDIVNIDFEGFIDGEAFDGGKGEKYDLELGSGQFIPGFEDQLVGTGTGDEVDVNVTFPENYSPELAGKAACFKVKVNEVKVKELPELDDEFAKDVSEYDTLEEYTASVRDEIDEHKREEAQKAFEEVVMSRLADNVECEIPDAMVEEHLDSMLNNFRYNLSSRGMDMEEYFSMMGTTVEAFRREMRPSAVNQIKLDLAFEHIAKTEDFPVTDEDVEAEYKRLAEEYHMEAEDVKRAVTADSVKTGLKLEAAKKLVIDTAVPEKPESGEEAGEESGKSEE